jgi:hypothetical protein
MTTLTGAADDELDRVTGGLVVISIIGICIGLLFPAGRQDALITEESKLLVASS